MYKKTRIALGFLILLFGLVAGFWAYDIYEDRQLKLIIEGPVGMYGDPDSAAYQQLHPAPIRQLTAGDTVTVRRVRYGKDYMAIQVQTPDGILGWVVYGSNVKVIRPNT